MKKYSLTFLHDAFIGHGYETHNAMADCKALRDTVKCIVSDDNDLQCYTMSIQSSIEHYMWRKGKAELMKSYKSLISRGLLSKSMSERCAASGLLSSTHLQHAFLRSANYLEEVLSTITCNGKPRLTKDKQMLVTFQKIYA